MASRKPMDLSRYSDLHYDVSKNNFNSPPVYGPFEKLCLTDWGQSEIHSDITQAFNKMNIDHMTPLQQNSFLYLMNNHNTALVGFSKGKSTSYLASIFSLIMNSKNQQKSGLAPKAIIISSSLGSCSVLENLSKQLLCSTNEEIKVVVAYSSVSVHRTIAHLCNGCDVFIATPTSFYDLLLKTKLFSWSKLKHIVFDNIDLLLENYEHQMIHFSRILMNIKEKIEDLQMISVSVKWTHKIHAFLRELFSQWQYIFGSHLEAARYMNVKFSIVPGVENKLEKIVENLKFNIKWRRCVLISTNPKELRTIFKSIQKSDDDIEILLPDKLKCAKVYTLQKWSAPSVKNKLMLICSDDMLHDFYIDNADCLIHYDIPTAKQKFSTRFSVLQGSTNALLKTERSTYIFLSNSNKDMLQLPKIVEIMKAFGNGCVSPVLLKNSKLIEESFEKEKKHRLLCNSVLQFGSCPRSMTCQNRHIILKEIDEPFDNIPKSGLALVEILNIYDASHMTAKILKFNSTDNINNFQHWTPFTDNFDTVNKGLTELYADHQTRKHHKNPVIGDVVAVQLDNIREHRNTDFFRGIVVDFLDQKTMNPKLRVKLIDLGYDDIVSQYKVYSLPDEWKNMPSSIVDLFLISVKPVDFDKTWCSKADLYVKKQLKRAQDINSNFIVKIKMAFGTTVWVKKLYKKMFNPTSRMFKFEPFLPDILFDNSYADMNPQHFEQLTQLCVSAGIEVPLTSTNNNNNNNNVEVDHSNFSLDDFMSLYKLPQPQWAHLDNTITSVFISFVISPKVMFVLNSKYNDRVDLLNQTITEFVKDEKVEKLKHVVEGALCLAKNVETEQYSRCQIVGLLSNNGCVEVLFVDLGVFQWVQPDSLLTIHPNLITQLPFQVIECGLSGTKDELPSGKELDKLVNYVFNLGDGLFNLQIIDTGPSGKFTGGNHYEVLLFNSLITINFEFMKTFGQYCDNDQMGKLQQLLPCIVDEIEGEDVKMNDCVIANIEDVIGNEDEEHIENEGLAAMSIHFYESFLLPILGPEPLKKLVEKKELKSKECLAVITDVTEPVTETLKTKNENNNCSTATKSIGKPKSHDDQCVVPVDCVPLNEQIPVKNCKLKWNMKRQNPCFTCNTEKRPIIVPMCSWYQDSSNIYLKFNILEVDKLCVDCTTQSISFKAQFKDLLYTFNVTLYGSVIETSETHKLSYSGFYIKAEKLYKTDYKWPRLFSCQNWHPYLKYDLDHVEIKDIDSWIRGINKFKLMAIGTPLNKTSIDDNDSNLDSICEWDGEANDLYIN